MTEEPQKIQVHLQVDHTDSDHKVDILQVVEAPLIHLELLVDDKVDSCLVAQNNPPDHLDSHTVGNSAQEAHDLVVHYAQEAHDLEVHCVPGAHYVPQDQNVQVVHHIHQALMVVHHILQDLIAAQLMDNRKEVLLKGNPVLSMVDSQDILVGQVLEDNMVLMGVHHVENVMADCEEMVCLMVVSEETEHLLVLVVVKVQEMDY